jgi:hypothetical protein
MFNTKRTKNHEGTRGQVHGLDDEAQQTVFQSFRVEIHEEADTDPAHVQIGEALRFIRGQQRSNRLDFQDDGIIGPKAEWYCSSLVNDRDGNLAFKGNAGLFKFQAEALGSDGFQETGSDHPVDLDPQANNTFRQCSLLQDDCPS